MIHTPNQLKALVRNMSKGDSTKAQVIIRNYVMERFLERLSLSSYRGNLILKGGTLIAAMVGLDNRSTLDVDTTMKHLPLTEEYVTEAVKAIVAIPIEDGMSFEIKRIAPIMEETEYPGIRAMLEVTFETMRTPLRIDFSTDDVITPNEVSYSFKLLFEDRTISILAYNLETVLAEKIETLLTRGVVNTRMRDFYDLFVLENTQSHNIDKAILRAAFANTSRKRGSIAVVNDIDLVLDEIENNPNMMALWSNYQCKFDYATNVSWDNVMQAVRELCAVIRKNLPI